MRAPQAAFLLFLLLVALIGIGGYGYFIDAYKGQGPLTAEKTVYIAPGSSTEDIAGKLLAEGAIDHPLIFMLGAHLRKWEHNQPLKAGEYLLTPPLSAEDIITLLQAGKTYQRHVTIPEGLMSVEIVGILKEAEGLTGEIDAVPAEGTLLPETYNYSYGDSRADLIARMQKSMTAAIAELWPRRADNLPVKNEAEAVTLASVVEKETGLAAERPRVAGVFVNRLNKGMPLQSDPTVIYAVTEGKLKLDRQLSRKDLALDSPYNTYVVGGLPPGPIANPGRASLAAVLTPEQNDFYYFVADGTGGHAFSRTLGEHGKNVARWRAIERKAK